MPSPITVRELAVNGPLMGITSRYLSQCLVLGSLPGEVDAFENEVVRPGWPQTFLGHPDIYVWMVFNITKEYFQNSQYHVVSPRRRVAHLGSEVSSRDLSNTSRSISSIVAQWNSLLQQPGLWAYTNTTAQQQQSSSMRSNAHYVIVWYCTYVFCSLQPWVNDDIWLLSSWNVNNKCEQPGKQPTLPETPVCLPHKGLHE